MGGDIHSRHFSVFPFSGFPGPRHSCSSWNIPNFDSWVLLFLLEQISQMETKLWVDIAWFCVKEIVIEWTSLHHTSSGFVTDVKSECASKDFRVEALLLDIRFSSLDWSLHGEAPLITLAMGFLMEQTFVVPVRFSSIVGSEHNLLDLLLCVEPARGVKQALGSQKETRLVEIRLLHESKERLLRDLSDGCCDWSDNTTTGSKYFSNQHLI